MKHKHLIIFVFVTVAAWIIGTWLFLYYWPHLVNNFYKKAIISQGFGSGPVPVNTLYTEPQALFADPLNTKLAPGSSNLMTVGVNHDTLLVVGWLDLSQGPLILHVPDFSDRYYSVQFTDPFETDFAYVGTRTTGTKAGDYLIIGPGEKGQMALTANMTPITSPSNSVLVIGRILVYGDSDLSTAYGLAQQIRLTPFKVTSQTPTPTPTSTPAATPLAKGLVRGWVLLGPMCPGERIPPSSQCAQPYQTSIRIQSADSSLPPETISNDASGAFRVSLDPGTYTLTPQGGASSLPACRETQVVVSAGKTQDVRLYCDTGIR